MREQNMAELPKFSHLPIVESTFFWSLTCSTGENCRQKMWSVVFLFGK